MARAMLLKEDGNRHFQAGDFVGAEGLYSKAIIADPTNPALYTNRAMARLKLKLWESVISDCIACLDLVPDNIKGHYYLSQAQVELGNHEDAVEHALAAHKLCVAANDKSLAAITALVLRCKKERWQSRERRRAREDRDLEGDLADLIAKERDDALAAAGAGDGNAEERREIEAEYAGKLARLQRVFERSRDKGDRQRTVPDWAIDDIGFDFMVDPVITKTGKSYERATIIEHLRRHPTDPLTREPLQPNELRPNLALKQACDDFLEDNGWAVDW